MDMTNVPTPCYVVDKGLLRRNLEILGEVSARSGCKILLAQKGFSMFSLYPLIGRTLSGTTASSLHELRLGYEEMGGECHIFAPAYPERDFEEICRMADHIVFNSFGQWDRYRERVQSAPRKISCGIRINPGYSEVETEIYNPCAVGSRLGVTLENFNEELLEGIEGLHFHTMCEQGFDTLERTLAVVEERFERYIGRMKWLNLGGGHHITRPGYDVQGLISCLIRLRERYGVEVYLEPGEAVALGTGVLVASVLDTLENGMNIAILDASAACHMPDVLEMPYRPGIEGAGEKGEKSCLYRLAGNTCLAGDVIGDYSFDYPLKPGDRLVLQDMAHYTMVKNNTFNGMNLPAIAIREKDGSVRMVREFGYEDFKGRL